MRNGCNFYNESTEKEIVQKYIEGVPAKELAEMYGFRRSKSILDKVKKFGYNPSEIYRKNILKSKPYYSFSLEKIDSFVKAYILGIIITDGNVDNQGRFQINLTDEDAIQYISKHIKKDYKTYEPYRQKENGKYKNIHRILFSNKKLVEELKRFAVVSNKSKIMLEPDFTEDEMKYLPYVFRGMIDGNGWIRKDGKEFYICSGSKVFALWIKKTLENRLFMRDLNFIELLREYNGKESKVWYVRSSNDKNIKILKAIVYDKPVGMQRKYNRLYGIGDEPSENIMEDTA